MLLTIYVTTFDKKYVNNFYGLNESLEEVKKIANCDNVASVDLVHPKTGEIIVSYKGGELSYTSYDFIKHHNRIY